MTERENPCLGLKRRRLPGMHMITAVDGGMPLREALAAFFFMLLHDRVAHTCLTREGLERVKGAKQKAVATASSPDAMVLGNILGILNENSYAFEEWSYISDEDAFTFFLLADMAIEQTQRWINQGVELPQKTPFGILVERPAWAKTRYEQRPDDATRRNRELVARLLREVEQQSSEESS